MHAGFIAKELQHTALIEDTAPLADHHNDKYERLSDLRVPRSFRSNRNDESAYDDASLRWAGCRGAKHGESAGNRPLATPIFLPGWQKTVSAAPLQNIASSRRFCARVEIFIALVEPLVAGFPYREMLSSTELCALGQMTSVQARNRALAGRILLRTSLTHAVNGRIQPCDWRICTTEDGKPVLARGMPSLQFSISHAELVAAVAVSERLPVGIDIEPVRELPVNNLVEAFCCSCEQDSLHAASSIEKSREFTRLWTLKEAYTKLIGAGHSMDFASIGFSLEPPHLLHPTAQVADDGTYFETLWVTAGRTLHHLSIAIGLPPSTAPTTTLQVLTLSTANGGKCTTHTPNISVE
jgi:phosphopantetheinyl transferase